MMRKEYIMWWSESSRIPTEQALTRTQSVILSPENSGRRISECREKEIASPALRRTRNDGELSFGVTPPVFVPKYRDSATPIKGGVSGIGVAQSPLKAVTAYNDRGLNADTRHLPCGCATAHSGKNNLWRSGKPQPAQ